MSVKRVNESNGTGAALVATHIPIGSIVALDASKSGDILSDGSNTFNIAFNGCVGGSSPDFLTGASSIKVTNDGLSEFAIVERFLDEAVDTRLIKRIKWQMKFANSSNIDALYVRFGTDSKNYNQKETSVESLFAGWNSIWCGLSEDIANYAYTALVIKLKAPSIIGDMYVDSIVAMSPEDDWEECNGQLITDEDSPMFGTILDDLNQAQTATLTSLFIRGSLLAARIEPVIPHTHNRTFTSNLVAAGGSAGGYSVVNENLLITDPIGEILPPNITQVMIMKVK